LGKAFHFLRNECDEEASTGPHRADNVARDFVHVDFLNQMHECSLPGGCSMLLWMDSGSVKASTAPFRQNQKMRTNLFDHFQDVESSKKTAFPLLPQTLNQFFKTRAVVTSRRKRGSSKIKISGLS